jgi:hypothetical protein
MFFRIWPFGMLMRFSGSRRVMFTCLKCEKQWRPGSEGLVGQVVVLAILVLLVCGIAVFITGKDNDRHGSNQAPFPVPAARQSRADQPGPETENSAPIAEQKAEPKRTPESADAVQRQTPNEKAEPVNRPTIEDYGFSRDRAPRL